MKLTPLFVLNILLSLATCFVYYSPDIAPGSFEYACFIPFLIPLLIILNLVFIIYWIFKIPKYAFLSLFVIFAGYKYFARTYAVAGHNEPAKVTVTSYNVRVFNSYDHLRDKDMNSSIKMIDWLKDNPSDILCLQEYYDMPKSKIFNSYKKIMQNYPYAYYSKYLTVKEQSFGMAIFSKYPIIRKGTAYNNQISFNKIIFADIKILSDTIRIYNMHMQSMSIDDEGLAKLKINKESGKLIRQMLHKYKLGSLKRVKQLDSLLMNLDKSPYKSIVCGDLNEIPYSYCYEKLSERMNNSFQEAGKGFGITYTGKALLLRIDNHFADKRIKVKKFTTHSDIKYSDHFPTSGSYSW